MLSFFLPLTRNVIFHKPSALELEQAEPSSPNAAVFAVFCFNYVRINFIIGKINHLQRE